MSWAGRPDQAERLRAVPLPRVLQLSGAFPDPHDPHKWHTSQGVLSVQGAKFINWNRGVGGGGAIDLVIHLHQVAFADALRWLDHHFPVVPSVSTPPHSPPRAVLQLPPPDRAKLPRVERYLVQQRCLPASCLQELLASGDLYADTHANAVFLLRDDQHQPVGAELRGTGPVCWRGMAPGSRKDRGFFSVPSSPRSEVILCESAIDAASCFVLYPDRLCISTSGARPNPAWLGDLIEHGGRIACGFDRDATGEAMAQAMISIHPSIHRLRPPRHDWNDALRVTTAS